MHAFDVSVNQCSDFGNQFENVTKNSEKQNKTKQNKKWCYIPTPSLSIMYLSDSVYYYRDTCTFMVFAAPLTAAEKWNPPRFVRKDKQIFIMWDIQTMEYYTKY